MSTSLRANGVTIRTGFSTSARTTGCLLPDRTNKRNTPGDKPGVLRQVVLMSVTLVVVVLVRLSGLFHNRRLGGARCTTALVNS